jgi:hypothetical protein
MKKIKVFAVVVILFGILFCTLFILKMPASLFPEKSTKARVTIVCPANSSSNIKLAAKEARRYIYLHTNTLFSIEESANGNTISFKIDNSLEEQQYRLESDGNSLIISGGSDNAILTALILLLRNWECSFNSIACSKGYAQRICIGW